MSASPPLNPKTSRLLSNMGMRTSRRTGRQTFHAGMDIGSREGEGALITAVQGGTVEHVLSDDDRRRAFRGYGNGVVVDHGDGTWALYAHVQSVAPGLEPGMVVSAGQPLGRMGRTSNNTFRSMGVPHLHLELRRARRDGSSPFPGPYRYYNLDPAEWLGEKGLHFRRRGQLEIDDGSAIDRSRPVWQRAHPYTLPALSGLGQKPSLPSGAKSSLSSLSTGPTKSKAGVRYQWDVDAGYEPVRFDRDVWLGLPPWAWYAGGGAALLGAVALYLAARRKRRRR